MAAQQCFRCGKCCYYPVIQTCCNFYVRKGKLIIGKAIRRTPTVTFVMEHWRFIKKENRSLIFWCSLYNPITRLCLYYNHRTAICSNYPYGELCHRSGL